MIVLLHAGLVPGSEPAETVEAVLDRAGRPAAVSDQVSDVRRTTELVAPPAQLSPGGDMALRQAHFALPAKTLLAVA